MDRLDHLFANGQKRVQAGQRILKYRTDASFDRVSTPDETELEEHARLTELILDGKGTETATLMDSHLRGIESRLDFTSKDKGKLGLRSSLLNG